MAETEKMSLLDALAEAAGLICLSDLHNAGLLKCRKIYKRLLGIPAEAYPLRVWNDALYYLAKAPARDTQEQARKDLLRYFNE